MSADVGLVERLHNKFDAISEQAAVDQLTVTVPQSGAKAIFLYLRDEEGFRLALDLAVVDYLPNIPRFELVYHLYDPFKYVRLRVKVLLSENEMMESMTDVWPGLNWPEREAYDLFGVGFRGHPDLKRIYLPDDWEGHPLRKDYPLTGPRID